MKTNNTIENVIQIQTKNSQRGNTKDCETLKERK